MTFSMRQLASLSQNQQTGRSALKGVAAVPEAGTATRHEAIAFAEIVLPLKQSLPWLA